MSATATATQTKFQISLNVTDLGRSVLFYRALLATEPAMHGSKSVRFELAEPPVVLCLVPSGPVTHGSLNHVGLRLPSSAMLVEMQRRLEEAGIATQRQEGVECCYARQTKFWATDPDRNLWELYVLEEDIEHSGFGDAPHPAAQPAPAAVVWEHRLTEPVPERIPLADRSADEARLEGTFNARLETLRPQALLAEVFRILKPGGKIVIHGLAGDRALETPALPGLAALVQRVPAIQEPLDALRSAGFTSPHFETLGNVTCLPVDGMGLHEIRLAARRPVLEATDAQLRRVIYKGPLEQLVDENGTCYPCGRAVQVSAFTWETLRQGPAADQFLFLPTETTSRER